MVPEEVRRGLSVVSIPLCSLPPEILLITQWIIVQHAAWALQSYACARLAGERPENDH